MIIRNSAAVRATESIWTHQRVTVRQSPLEVLEPLAARIQCAPGQEIYKEDSPVDYWYRIISGVARRFWRGQTEGGKLSTCSLPAMFSALAPAASSTSRLRRLSRCEPDHRRGR